MTATKNKFSKIQVPAWWLINLRGFWRGYNSDGSHLRKYLVVPGSLARLGMINLSLFFHPKCALPHNGEKWITEGSTNLWQVWVDMPTKNILLIFRMWTKGHAWVLTQSNLGNDGHDDWDLLWFVIVVQLCSVTRKRMNPLILQINATRCEAGCILLQESKLPSCMTNGICPRREPATNKRKSIRSDHKSFGYTWTNGQAMTG